jgi:serine/threonine-protein kinase
MATGPGPGETLDDTSSDPVIGTAVAETLGHTESGRLELTRPMDERERSEELAGGTMVGEYRIEGKLGEGGMGTVYGALHPVIGKRAAVKVIKRNLCASPESVERFVLEARAVNQIGHPNIVDVFAFGVLPDGRSYFVMEWLRGESLAERLRRDRMPFGEALDVLDGVIRGLEAAHDKQIIHRDLKPDNVYLVEVRGERPMVKLLDFGIAKLTGGEDNRVERTRTGAMIGTPQYIAPEQARGLAVDFRVDVYSLGVMAFEIFTGRPPFVAKTAMDMVAKHLNEIPPRASTIAPIPAALDALLHDMLEKEPGDRPSLVEVRAVLDEIRTASVNVALVGTVPEASAPAGVVARRKASRRRMAMALTAVLVIAGIVAAVAVNAPRTPAKAAVPEAAETKPAVKESKPEVEVEEPPVAPVAPPIVETKPEVVEMVVPVHAKSKTKGKGKTKPGTGTGTGTGSVTTTIDDDDGVVRPFDRKKSP